MIRSLLMPHRLISLDLAAGSRRDYQHIAQFGNASSSSSYADVPFSRTPGSAVPAESIIALNVQGNVLWFDFAGGFGRIARKDGKEDVFVHATEIVPTNKDHRQLTELGEGEPVEFDIVEDRSNGTRRAIRVTGPAGAPVQGRWTLFRHFAFGQKLKRSEVMPYKADGRIIARNVRGTVAYFSVPYGYGFITRSDTGNDVFAHFRDIVVANPKHAVKSLGTGETVRFHILLESHGRVKAVGITGPNGEAVMGDVNAEGPATRDILRRAGTTLLGGRSPLLARRSLVHGSAVTGLRFVGTGTSADNSSPVNVDTNGPLNEMISKLLEPFKCVLKKQDNLRRLISEMEVPTSTPTSTPIGVLPLFTYSSDWRWIVDKNLIMVVASLTIAFSIIAVIMVAASWYINGTVNELKVEGKQQRDEMRMEGKQQRDEMRMEGKQQREELKQQVDRIENLMKKLIAGFPPCRRHFADGVSHPASSTPLNLAFATQTSSGAFAPAAQHVQGKVLWFNSRKGYGFVTRSDTGENIFVNAVDIAMRNPKQPSASLDDGEPIEFDVVVEPSGKPRAMRVTGPGGVPVRGKASPFAVAASDQQRLQLESRGTIVERNVKGVVKWYNLVKRYGFITRSDTGKEIYVTSRGILRANRAHALRSLGAGEAVQFHVLEKAPGLYEAVGVTGPNHAPVRGSPDAEGPLALRIFQGDFDYLRVQRLKRQEEAQREGLRTLRVTEVSDFSRKIRPI